MSLPFLDSGESTDTTSSDSSTGSNSGSSLGSSVTRFVQNPKAWVFARISEYIIALAFGVVVGVNHLVTSTWSTLTWVFTEAADAVFSPLGAFGAGLLSLASAAARGVWTTALDAGPLAIVVLVVLWVGLMVVLYRTISAISADIPVLSAIRAFIRG
ncbi:hypothetical protein [Halocalculus aciditolerans]|uniref:Uncharacterized protein n=1 Tax=Halocalculus aciditolerans TaxID=1383812 RepID=A0A830F300_9EURY|nr:hypothetical protein [Halocalculus aciditolerans]GGL57594.1 hypothetical protein GCM10009039_14690 [Halocalculus aciditolerans]